MNSLRTHAIRVWLDQTIKIAGPSLHLTREETAWLLDHTIALLDALDEAERRIALAHEVGDEIGERCAGAEAEVERLQALWRSNADAFDRAYQAMMTARGDAVQLRAERDFEERRADGLAAELAALRERIEDVRETFYSGDYGALVESVRTLLATPTDPKEA